MRYLSPRLLAAVLAVTVPAVAGAALSTPENIEKLRSTNACAGCDLFGAELQGLQAPKADLTGANLSEATLYGANLAGANLTGATLDDANLAMANLEGAIGVVFSTAKTDWRTVCPDGSAGPCQ